MRKGIALGVTALMASLAFATEQKLEPLNLKTGLWQSTTKWKYTGLPPQMAQIAEAAKPTRPAKLCLKPEDLNPDKWTTKGLGLNCSSITVLKSTGTDLEVGAKGCDAGNGMTADGHGEFHVLDSEHVTGSIDATFTGNMPFPTNGSAVHMHIDYTHKWLGGTCPAGMR